MPRRLVSLILREPAGDAASPAVPWRIPFKEAAWRPGVGETRPSALRACLASLAVVGLITILGLWIVPLVRPSILVIFYVLGIVFLAMRLGRLPAVIGALSSALLFCYFFPPPYRSLAVTDTAYLITVIGFLAVSLIVSLLAANARQEAREARRQEAYTAALYSLTKSLAVASDLDQILDAVRRHLFETFQRPIVILLPAPEGLTIRLRSPELVLDDNDSATADSVFESGTGRLSGSAIYYEPLKTAQGVVGVIGLLADRSKQPLPPDQRRLLDTFLSLAALAITRAVLAQEARRAEVLQETDKLQKALLNTISHNLGTPLATIIGALDILADGTMFDASTQKELLETARVGAARLNKLVHNLLDMTRLEGGAARVRSEPCDVQDVVGAALEQVREAARGRSISVAIPPDLPFVPMDAVLIVQVLVNLLDNALKYSPENAPIAVEAGQPDGQLRIRVADGGPGIAKQELERVFEKFFRGSAAAGSGGAGLGLAICKGFVEAHGGRIWAERGPQGGTQMIFTLPLERQR